MLLEDSNKLAESCWIFCPSYRLENPTLGHALSDDRRILSSQLNELQNFYLYGVPFRWVKCKRTSRDPGAALWSNVMRQIRITNKR